MNPQLGTRKSWEREWNGAGEPMNNPATASPRKPGWEREVQLFRYLTRPETSVVIDPSISRSPEQKIYDRLDGFAFFLARNVRDSDDPGAPDDSRRRRKAVEAQWRAILMIDEEIQKYQPKYEWYGSAIRNALRNKVGK